ncbi:MAG TPA: hypothetical protein VMU01_02400 [Rhizomicrobium sp.]|nr:hypothetical protein [Rhizomicrobium sp.]
MRMWTKSAVLGACLTGAVLAAGCESDYYRDGYHDRGRYGYDHDRYDRDRYDRDRRWTCDSDGDDCRGQR